MEETPPLQTTPFVWALVDDRPGTSSQVLGIAEKLGWPFETRKLHYGTLASLPNWLMGASRLGLGKGSDKLTAPWPDIVIAAGRRAAPVARWIKHQSPSCFLTQIMWPGSGINRFGLIATPLHDNIRPRKNVISTLLAPHRLTAETLATARAQWKAKLAELPRPLVAVLAGGRLRKAPLSPDDFHRLAAWSRTLAEGGTLLVTTSRRTDAAEAEILKQALTGAHLYYDWRMGEDNPYMGFLAHADLIVVTGDSVSMISEACYTGKPVYVYTPPAQMGDRYMRFHQQLYKERRAVPLSANSPRFYPADQIQDAANEIAVQIRNRFEGYRRTKG